MAIMATALSAATFTGCVDDAYDLENINTDIEVKVNDLVVPINLDAITLSNAFDLDPESVVKEINGEYAVVVDGDFKSDPITVNPVSITPGTIQPIRCTIFKYDGGDINLPVAAQTISYLVTEATTDFSFSSNGVDKTIRDLKKVKGTWNIDVKLNLSDNNGLFSQLSFHQLVMQLPAGLHVSNYPCNNGNVTVGDVEMNIGRDTYVKLIVDEIDFTKFDSDTYTFTPATGDLNNGIISFNGKVGVLSGYVIGATNSTTANMPQNVEMLVTPEMNRIDVESVTGTIAYSIDGFEVADVELSDLPDMLRQNGTDVSLANPQLYLSLNNPVATYGLEAASGLTLTSIKDNQTVKVCSLDPATEIVLASDKGNVGPYNFCLAPTNPANYYEGYAGSQFVGYKSLSGLLSGSGLPDCINVSFDNPRVLPGEVNDFLLNTTISSVEGNYTLYAPLELTVGSRIVYEEEETGWDDETIRKITITTLKVAATVTNSLPVDIIVSGTPLDVNGNPCVDPKTKQPVKLEGLKVAAGATSPIELRSTGTIVGIDGIRYTATCDVKEAGKVLKPSETIDLKNIRVTVGGSYLDTL